MKKLWKHRHYGEHVVIGGLLVVSVLEWLPLPSGVGAITAGVTTGAMVFAFFVHYYHLTGALCETCISAMPLDTERAVKRARPALRVWHLLASRRNNLILLGGLVVVTLASALLKDRSVPEMTLNSVCNLVVVSMFVSNGAHRRLGPWCPWCYRGDGDDDRVMVPDPVAPERV